MRALVAAGVALSLAAAGCKSCTAERGKPEISPKASRVPEGAPNVNAADAGDGGDGTMAEREGGPTAIEVAIVARLATSIEGASLHRLRDGVALSQKSERGWNVLTAGRGKALANLTAGLPMFAYEPGAQGDDPLAVWGSVDEIWMSSAFGDSVHASRQGRPTRLRAHYRFVVLGPGRDNGVLGVPTSQPLAYMTDDKPTRFVSIREGRGALPTLSRDIRVWSLASLASLDERRLCAVGLEQTEAGASSLRGWSWSPSTGERFFDPGDIPDTPTVVAGRGGACLLVHGGATPGLTIAELGDGGVTKLGHVPAYRPFMVPVFDVTTAGDALWTADAKPARIYRTDLTKLPLAYREYTLPDDAGCRIRHVEGIAAIADDDVWLLAACEEPARWALLHTEPRAAKVRDLPPPASSSTGSWR